MNGEGHVLCVRPIQIETLVAQDYPAPGSSAEEWRATVSRADRRAVEAWRLGPFAIHQSVGEPGWAVTHIATGMALRTGITTRRLALGIAAEVLLLLPDAWDFTDPDEPRTWPPSQLALIVETRQ